MGKRIASLRSKKKMTQESLAKALQLSRTSITNIEKGRQKILVHTLWQLSKVFDCDPNEFFPSKRNSLKTSLPLGLGDVSNSERIWLQKVVGGNYEHAEQDDSAEKDSPGSKQSFGKI